MASVSNVTADGIDIFYRWAGSPDAPILLLLHGFPSSSHQFRNLIPLLATAYHVIAPDLPSYGFTNVPASRYYAYTFANLTQTILAFLDALKIKHFAVYIFDYGAPVAFRIALERPDSIKAIISQNGNAYIEGLGQKFWAPIEKYWKSGSVEDRNALAYLAGYDTTKLQYTLGSPQPEKIQPESYTIDYALLSRPGIANYQLDLLYDYRTNVALYPQFQEYLRKSQVPLLAAWGKNDVIFVKEGAEAFKRDLKHAEVHLLDAGHFAVETETKVMADLILRFLKKHQF